MVKLEEERLLAENELFKFKENFEKSKEENEKIFKEKLELLKELEENKLKIEKYEEDKKLELINLAKLKNENEEIFKEKAQLLKEFKEYKIKMTKIEEVNKSNLTKTEEDNKKLTKKSEISENIICQLRQEISQNKKNYKQEIKQVKDLAENRVEQIKTLTERNAAYSDAKYEAEKKAKELLTKIEQLQIENKDFVAKIQLKDEKIRSFEKEVETWKSLNDSRKKELDKLNKENDKYIFFVKRPNKMCTIKNEDSCCEINVLILIYVLVVSALKGMDMLMFMKIIAKGGYIIKIKSWMGLELLGIINGFVYMDNIHIQKLEVMGVIILYFILK
uniref:Uncharacterized protein n=1 Tax=Meloidogyne enterolobii TaxID=390850 RepID=A0A6V7W7V9_MELEN|nr:unnamed protein product [Meloidogyne enterolobii]